MEGAGTRWAYRSRPNLKTMAAGKTDADTKTIRAVRQFPPVNRAIRNAMAAQNAIIKPVAPMTGAEKKAYRRENHRNTQAQLNPRPTMTQ